MIQSAHDRARSYFRPSMQPMGVGGYMFHLSPGSETAPPKLQSEICLVPARGWVNPTKLLLATHIPRRRSCSLGLTWKRRRTLWSS